MSKGTAFTRVIAYFRTADLTEAIACLQSATEVVAGRGLETEAPTKRSYTRRTRTDSATPINGEAQGATS